MIWKKKLNLKITGYAQIKIEMSPFLMTKLTFND